MRRAEVTQHHIGIKGEAIAADYLERKHYQILERNYRSITGEIDIICQENKPSLGTVELVFVEVKTRRGELYGEPIEAVTNEKLQRIRRAAEMYMMQHAQEDLPCRIDVIGILFGEEGTQVEHIQDVVDY